MTGEKKYPDVTTVWKDGKVFHNQSGTKTIISKTLDLSEVIQELGTPVAQIKVVMNRKSGDPDDRYFIIEESEAKFLPRKNGDSKRDERSRAPKSKDTGGERPEYSDDDEVF